MSITSTCLVEIDGNPLADDIASLLVSAYVDDSLRLPDLFVLRFRDSERMVVAKSGVKIGSKMKISVASDAGPTAQPLIQRRGLTLIGIMIANLENDLPLQLCLPFDCDNGELLDGALDEIRTRYGPTAVTRGILLGRRPALDMPLLPD